MRYIADLPLVVPAHAKISRSRGHLCFVGSTEFFLHGDKVYRASARNPKNGEGRRYGAVFWCGEAEWPARLQRLLKSHEAQEDGMNALQRAQHNSRLDADPEWAANKAEWEASQASAA